MRVGDGGDGYFDLHHLKSFSNKGLTLGGGDGGDVSDKNSGDCVGGDS